MITFDKDNIRLLPVYYNMLMASKSKRMQPETLGETEVNEIAEHIKESMNEGKILLIDMQFVDITGGKTDDGKRIVNEFKGLVKDYSFAFCNIQKSPDVIGKFVNSLEAQEEFIQYFDIFNYNMLSSDCLENQKWGAVIFSNNICKKGLKERFGNNIAHGISDFYANTMAEILKKDGCVISNETLYLPSSDIYSNTYIRIKELFLYPEDLNLCVYLLCKLISDKFAYQRIDAIVSMSNTGAVLANLVGKMMEKDVLFCTNVGPQFALDINNINGKIVKNKNYLYVFDFICLGTEIKNLNTIMICHEATLMGGVGVASLPDLDKLRTFNPPTQEERSVLRKAYSIVPILNHSIDYKISVQEDSLQHKNGVRSSEKS